MTKRSKPPKPPEGWKRGRDAALDKQLLALVVAQPRRLLILAISTGMAIAQEMFARRLRGELDTLGVSEDLCERACDVVLEQWAVSARAGSISEADFQKIVDKVIGIARSS